MEVGTCNTQTDTPSVRLKSENPTYRRRPVKKGKTHQKHYINSAREHQIALHRSPPSQPRYIPKVRRYIPKVRPYIPKVRSRKILRVESARKTATDAFKAHAQVAKPREENLLIRKSPMTKSMHQ